MINFVGDPVDMLVNPESLPEEIDRVRKDFGLDQPVYVQYWKFLYLYQHMEEFFEAIVRKQLTNKNTEIELVELDCIVQVSGLREYEEEEQIIISIKEINLDQMKLLVKAYKTCPLGESPHRLVAID